MIPGLIAEKTPGIAVEAVLLSSEYVVPMADSIILATVRSKNATLWTFDEHFMELENVVWIKKE
ncbi:MAG: hypothetical protein C0401_09180 [Anaerolinea sp.]|nr:hypothetical protein [Anaerolinea sp.]